MRTRFFFGCVAAAAVVAAVVPSQASAQTTDSPAVLLVLDKDALDYGPAPHLLPEGAVDPDAAGIGVREELPYFQNHVGSQVILPSGQNGNGGWFALRSVPAAWATSNGAGDGLQNFALAGPGLGSPDDNGDRESLLGNVSDVAALRADGLGLLVGSTVCAVVYGGDVTVTPGTPSTASLQGATLGRIAFTIVSLAPTDDPDHPNVQVQIAEGHETCAGALAAFAAAPIPGTR